MAIRTQKDLHILRKAFHFSAILAIFSCMVLFRQETNWLIYLSVGLPLVMLDGVRLGLTSINKTLVPLFAPLLRKKELKNFTGASYAIIGIGLSYLIFPKPISQLAVLFLAVGDPTASFFGVKWGKSRIFGDKSWAGSLAAWFFCSLAALTFLLFLTGSTLSLNLLLPLALTLGSIGALAELIPIGKLDDNLTQPLISGFIMLLLFELLPPGALQ